MLTVVSHTATLSRAAVEYMLMRPLYDGYTMRFIQPLIDLVRTRVN